MTAVLIEEVENGVNYDDKYEHDDESSIPEILRTSSGKIMDSLDKLTDEIKAVLVSDDEAGSVTGRSESSSNDDEDFDWDGDGYYSDEDDPDSGENKLNSMMDDLVTELMTELQDDSIGEVDQKQQSGNSAKDDESITRREAKNQHVKTLLAQVTELTKSMSTKRRKSIQRNEHNDKISANIQRKIEQGDYDADRLEHLMNAIATYTKFREANINAIPEVSSPSTQCSKGKAKKNKRKKRTNKHKKKKSEKFIQTEQSLHILFDSLSALDDKLSRENTTKS